MRLSQIEGLAYMRELFKNDVSYFLTLNFACLCSQNAYTSLSLSNFMITCATSSVGYLYSFVGKVPVVMSPGKLLLDVTTGLEGLEGLHHLQVDEQVKYFN